MNLTLDELIETAEEIAEHSFKKLNRQSCRPCRYSCGIFIIHLLKQGDVTGTAICPAEEVENSGRRKGKDL